MQNLTSVSLKLRLFKEEEKVFLAIWNILTCITAVCGNTFIIASIRRVSSLHLPSKVLLVCLALTDLCVGVITQPLYVAHILFPECHSIGLYLLIGYNTAGFLFSGVSMLTITAISVDRPLAVTLGLRYRQVVTVWRTRILLVSFWTISMAFGMMFFHYFDVTSYLTVVIILLCILISTFCYVKICYALRHHQVTVQPPAHKGEKRRQRVNQLNVMRFRKTVISALWVQATFLMCFLPLTIIMILVISSFRTATVFFIRDLAISLLFFNSSLNPFIYCWKIKHMRQAVRGTVKRCLCFLQG